MREATPPEQQDRHSMLLGAWITALILSVFGAAEVRAWIAHDHALGTRSALLLVADALVAVSEIAHVDKLAETASTRAAEARPTTLWLRAPEEPGAPEEPDAEPLTTGGTGATPPSMTPAPVQAPAAAAPAAAPPRLLLIGASSIQLHFGAELERELRASYPGATVKRVGRLGTGLVRDDYFDWPAKTLELLDAFRPDVVIAQFGGNDAQAIAVKRGTPLAFGTPEWDEAFGGRIAALVELVRSRGARFISLGMPMMQSPKLSKKVAHINALFEARVTAGSGVFIPTWDLSTTPSGEYTNAITVEGTTYLLRDSDGVHVTREGAVYLARKVTERLERHVPRPPSP